MQGWGSELLLRQNADGNWGKGIYNPKWTSTTYTLLLLKHLGLSSANQQALRGCDNFFFRGLEKDGGLNLFKNLHYSETCINGMILSLLSYFRHPDPRIHSIAEFLLRQQMPDGGWNCDRIKGATHASFHTTISTLEGFAEYQRAFPEKQ
jgi:squalene cyclase